MYCGEWHIWPNLNYLFTLTFLASGYEGSRGQFWLHQIQSVASQQFRYESGIKSIDDFLPVNKLVYFSVIPKVQHGSGKSDASKSPSLGRKFLPSRKTAPPPQKTNASHPSGGSLKDSVRTTSISLQKSNQSVKNLAKIAKSDVNPVGSRPRFGFRHNFFNNNNLSTLSKAFDRSMDPM